MEKILVIDDDRAVRTLLDKILSQLECEPVSVDSGVQGLARLREESFFAVFTDLKMPDMDGIEVLEKTKALDPDMPVVIMTAFGSIETAVRAMKLGADDFILKPFPVQQIEVTISRIRGKRAMRQENVSLKEILKRGFAGVEMVGKDPSLREVLELVEKVAPTDTTVLIEGESGTGKELVARALHRRSGRPAEKFVSINCAAFAEGLLESEIFGHEAGAFTGATGRKSGLIEVAEGGTLLLDEIGETAPAFQVKLLRALQEKSFFRVGGTKPVRVDVRFVASTNRNLAEDVQSGRFRKDLFYRLSVFPIRLPPLRRRRGDVPLLVDLFTLRFARRAGRQEAPAVDDAVREQLLRYDWPGNVRELENVIERAVLLAGSGPLRLEHLPPEIIGRAGVELPMLDLADLTLRQARERLEEMYLRKLLHLYNGNVSRSAEHAGIGRGTFHEKLNRHDIDALEYRQRGA